VEVKERCDLDADGVNQRQILDYGSTRNQDPRTKTTAAAKIQQEKETQRDSDRS